MHLTVASHFCGGEISQIKFSFTHQKATCGMCNDEKATSTEKSIDAESCCKDQMSFFVVDNNYSPTTLQINFNTNHLLSVFDIPKTLGIQSIYTNSTFNINVQPPGNYNASAVNLPDICVFRI